jgi:protease II
LLRSPTQKAGRHIVQPLAYLIWAVPGRDLVMLTEADRVEDIAHVRGGSEKGWCWYREGKLAKKMNTFSDFIAVSEYLVKQGWAAGDKLVAHGGSAGGTLIGAVANIRPDLYAGLIAEVPFVDVLNTMLDETRAGLSGDPRAGRTDRPACPLEAA